MIIQISRLPGETEGFQEIMLSESHFLEAELTETGVITDNEGCFGKTGK